MERKKILKVTEIEKLEIQIAIRSYGLEKSKKGNYEMAKYFYDLADKIKKQGND